MRTAGAVLVSAIALVGVLAIVACGGGNGDAIAPSSDAGDVVDTSAPTFDGGGVDASRDATADIEQDPNVYPAMHHPIPAIDNQGGPLLDHMQLVTVTFAGDTRRDTLRSFGHSIGTTDWWHETIGTYGLADAVVGPDVELPSTLPSAITDDDLHTYLKEQIAAGALPVPTAETLYLIYTPHSLSITVDALGASCQGFDGYHGSVPVIIAGADGGASTVVDAAYAVVCECSSSLKEMTITASHEIAEAATDPNIQDTAAYYMYTDDSWEQHIGGGQVAGEVGDLCSWQSWTEGSWEVQRIYSNAAAAASKNPCQPSPLLYYGAAPRTTMRIVNGIRMDGRMSVVQGQSVDIVLDAFSEAALPNDFTLYVGSNIGPGANGVSAIGPGITSRLTKSVVHNGNGVVMTIATTSSTPKAEYPFVIRSVLNANDANDWPVIINVH